MFAEDKSRTHVDAVPAQIVGLFEATNQPLVQPPGGAAQAAQAVVVGVKGRRGIEVLIALTLTQSGENLIYTLEGPVPVNKAQEAFDEAVVFAESMGFILDTTGWHSLDAARREELIARLPAFREPTGGAPVAPVERPKVQDPLAAVARLFAAFSLACAVGLCACSGPSGEQRSKGAEIHYDLGTNAMNEGNAQGALGEYLAAEHDDPDMPQVHNALGLLYGFSFDRPVEAEHHFRKAIELQKDFSEAYNNYGAFLLQRGRYTDAIPLFEKAIGNPLYTGRAIAESNLGWALFKSGSADRGVARIRSALLVAPKYCKGWRQLGSIYAEVNKLDKAAEAFARYRAECPAVADAWLQEAKVLTRLSRPGDARAAFQRCAEVGKGKDAAVADECARSLREMGSP
jgi:type IV pilus biogenesis/stability protein PilW